MRDKSVEKKVQVLVAEDDLALRDAVTDTLELSGCEVKAFSGAEGAVAFLEKNDVDIVFSDVCMGDMDGHSFLEWVQVNKPYIPFVLMTAYGTIERSVDAMRMGAADYLVKPFQPRALIDLLEQFVGGSNRADSHVVEDPRMRAVYELAARVAQTDSTVLIAGESGTGKEVMARAIHARSLRADKAFVAINCAAIPESMLEATLFGHEKGAFTGAYTSAPGKFEQANGGTLLLDEISEMDLGLQAKLLRVIQEREVERVGGRKTIPLDVRIVATTNRNLRRYVEEKQFREDLYYRLSVFPVLIPPLRERSGDIVPLAEYLLRHHAQRMNRAGMVLESSAKEKLLSHHWPGNVRELDNVMQRALILAVGNGVSSNELLLDPDFESADASDLDGYDQAEGLVRANTVDGHSGVADDHPHATSGDLHREMNHHEVEQIQQALAQTRGSKKDAAELLGLSPRTLRYRMARLRDKGLLD